MATVTLPIAKEFVVLDEAATPSTGVLRDSQGNIAVAQVAGTDLKTSGVLTVSRSSKTSAFTAGAFVVYSCDATSAAFAATLPPAATVPGRVYVFKKIDSSGNAVTVTGNGAETIDGSNTVALSTQWAKVMIVSNGTSWEKLV
jgi:hypothetical protein